MEEHFPLDLHPEGWAGAKQILFFCYLLSNRKISYLNLMIDLSRWILVGFPKAPEPMDTLNFSRDFSLNPPKILWMNHEYFPPDYPSHCIPNLWGFSSCNPSAPGGKGWKGQLNTLSHVHREQDGIWELSHSSLPPSGWWRQGLDLI